MQIIPVLDLKNGLVVRAEGGKRDGYRPIVTPLSATPEPADVAEGLLRLHPFRTLYVADLDAIEGKGNNLVALRQLRSLVDCIWVDAGVNDEQTALTLLDQDHFRVVIGSESQTGTALLERLGDDPRIILSLDFFADGYRGPREILERPDLWPQDVIVMTLSRVGAADGPDLDRLQEVMRRAPNRQFHAAGGARTEAQLDRLADLGVAGVLVSSALHANTLSGDALSRFS